MGRPERQRLADRLVMLVGEKPIAARERGIIAHQSGQHIEQPRENLAPFPGYPDYVLVAAEVRQCPRVDEYRIHIAGSDVEDASDRDKYGIRRRLLAACEILGHALDIRPP